MTFNLNWFIVAFIVLLVLKLTNVVAWSWWIICIPLYPVAVFGLVFLGILAFGGFMFASFINELFKVKK